MAPADTRPTGKSLCCSGTREVANDAEDDDGQHGCEELLLDGGLRGLDLNPADDRVDDDAHELRDDELRDGRY